MQQKPTGQKPGSSGINFPARDPLQKQLSDIEDQIRLLKNRTDHLPNAGQINIQSGSKNPNPAAVSGLLGQNIPLRESLDDTLDIVDGQKVDLGNPEIKYLMDEVHMIQGKMKKLETENQKLKNDITINSNKRHGEKPREDDY